MEIFKPKDSQDNLTYWLISTGNEQRDAALDFLALTCRAYDSYLEDWARHHAPRNGAGRLLARHALPLRESVTDFWKWDPEHNDAHALFDAITRADEAGAVSSLRRLAASYETEALGYERVGVDGAGPGTAAFERWAGVDDAVPPRVSFLEQQCATRRACSKPGGARGILIVYARELCARSFADDVLASPFLFRAQPLLD